MTIEKFEKSKTRKIETKILKIEKFEKSKKNKFDESAKNSNTKSLSHDHRKI